MINRVLSVLERPGSTLATSTNGCTPKATATHATAKAANATRSTVGRKQRDGREHQWQGPDVQEAPERRR